MIMGYITKEQARRIIITAFESTNYMEDAWAYCTQKLRALPPADVVEVVRCKDCKHFIPQTGWGFGRCSHLEDRLDVFEVIMLDNDYCSDGKQKNRGENDE